MNERIQKADKFHRGHSCDERIQMVIHSIVGIPAMKEYKRRINSMEGAAASKEEASPRWYDTEKRQS
jgi:predicted metallopeptidase